MSLIVFAVLSLLGPSTAPSVLAHPLRSIIPQETRKPAAMKPANLFPCGQSYYPSCNITSNTWTANTTSDVTQEWACTDVQAESAYPPPPQHFSCPQANEPGTWIWWHHGIDFDDNSQYPYGISCSNGTNGPGSTILASRYGTVTIAQVGELQIQTTDGFYLTYYHIQQVLNGLGVGSSVTPGESIAMVGNYGATNCHLHFEVTTTSSLGENGGQDVDPTAWINTTVCNGAGIPPAVHPIPAATPLGSDTHLFVRAPDGSLYHRLFVNGNWTCFGGLFLGNPSAVTFNSMINVFVRGPDSLIYDARWDGNSQHAATWVSLAAAMTSDPVAVVFNGKIHVLARGQAPGYDVWDGSSSDGTHWTWQRFDAGAHINGKPAAVVVGATSQLLVVVLGSDNTVWWDWMDTGGGVHSWQAIATPNKTSLSNPAIDSAFGAAEIAIYANDSQVWESTFGPTWSAWSPIGGHLAGDPDVLYSSSPGARIDVFVRGLDNALYDFTSAWTDLFGSINNDPFGVVISGYAHVLARGQDGALWDSSDSTGWTWTSLGAPMNQTLPGIPSTGFPEIS